MKIKLLTVSLLFFVFSWLSAQTDFSSLKRIYTSAGTECYVYIVQPQDGVLAVGRRFNVSPQEIYALNPSAVSGLKEGQPLYIPIKGKTAVAAEKTTVSVNDTATSPAFIEHRVVAGETLFGLLRKYDVSENDLLRYNPMLAKGLIAGQIIKIPQKTAATADSSSAPEKQQTSANAPSANPAYDYQPSSFDEQGANQSAQSDEDLLATAKKQPMTAQKAMRILEIERLKRELESPPFIEHTIKPKETLYSISRLYGVFVEDIVNANPMLESTLLVGQVIKIPSKSAFATSPMADTLASDYVLKIAFLLPFTVVGGEAANTERFVDFYSGALIALEEAKNKGESFEIYTFDTDRTEAKITEILKKSELKEMDFIIGPAYTNQIPAVADFAKRNKIYTVIPFSSKVQGIASNPYLFQFNPTENVCTAFEAEELLSGNFKNANLIFVKPKNVEVGDDGWTWSAHLLDIFTEKGKTVQQIEWNDPSNTSEPLAAMIKGVRNVFVFRTDRYTMVQPYLAAIESMPVSDYMATLYARFSWLNLSLNRNSIVYVSPFAGVINSVGLDGFRQKYSHWFKWNPANLNPRYDLLGYDLTTCFLQHLRAGGRQFADGKTAVEFPLGVQSQLRFERHSPEGGFDNRQLYFVHTIGK